MNAFTNPIPVEWLDRVPMEGIHWHWPAGRHMPGAAEFAAYHFLIDGMTGKWHRGVPVRLNSGSLKPGYAAHTLNANTNRIGIGLCGMGGATEVPFNPGQWPIRAFQVDSLIEGCKQLSRFYNIPVTRRTMLSHAEVETTLGIKQRAKWDWTRLPDEVTSLRGALNIGDWIRGRIEGKDEQMSTTPLPIPAMATGRVSTNGSGLITRNGPNGQATGSLPNGTTITVLREQGDWLLVRSPAGFEVWVARRFVDIIDGPQPVEPTTPDPRRAFIADMRAFLDAYEAKLD